MGYMLVALLALGASGCNETLGIDDGGLLYVCNSNDDCGFGNYQCVLSNELNLRVCRPADYVEPEVSTPDVNEPDATPDVGPELVEDTGPDIPLGAPCGPYNFICPVGYTCDSTSGRCTDTDGMVFVAAGSFAMGCDPGVDSDCTNAEAPVHTVNVPAFMVDRLETTVGEYTTCVTDGACQAPNLNPDSAGGTCNFGVTGRNDHPINCLLHQQAQSYCQWRDARLCTEAEWEMAARGSCDTLNGDCGQNMRKYPWGDAAPTCDLANYVDCGADTKVVGQHSEGASVYGVEDMSGNVREWVQDAWHTSYEGAPTDGSAWTGGTYSTKRGGAFLHPAADMRASTRSFDFTFEPTVGGIRCCADFSQ